MAKEIEQVQPISHGVKVLIVLTGMALIPLAVYLFRQQANTITGNFILVSSDFISLKTGDTCEGSGGYNDINENTQVEIKDGDGSILGLTKLGTGSVDEDNNCSFNYALNNISKTNFYSIQLARRGEIKYSHDELEEKDFKIETTLGN